MLTVVDPATHRLINLTKMLLEKDDWIKIKEIASHLNVSVRTINADLKTLKENYPDEFSIETSIQQGIRLTNMTTTDFLQLQSNLLLESLPIKFLLALMEEPNKDLIYYVKKTKSNSSALYRKIASINKYLKTYQLKIESSGGHFSLTGENELVCRRFFTTFLFEVYGCQDHQLISMKTNHLLKKRFIELCGGKHDMLLSFQLIYFNFFYYVSIKREQQGYLLHPSNQFSENYLALSQDDYLILSQDSLQIDEDSLNKIEASVCIYPDTLLPEISEFYQKTIKNFLTELIDKHQLEIKDLDFIYLNAALVDLSLNIKYICIPYYLINNHFSFFSKSLETNHSITYNKLMEYLKKLEEQTELNYSTYYDYIIYLLITIFPDLLENDVHQPILIVSNYSKKHAFFLFKRISTLLNVEETQKDAFTWIEESELSKFNLTNFSLIISNFKIEEPHTLLIRDFPSKENITMIHEFLNKKQKEVE